MRRKTKTFEIPLTMKQSGLDEYLCPDGELLSLPGEGGGSASDAETPPAFDPSLTIRGERETDAIVVFAPDDDHDGDIFIYSDGNTLFYRCPADGADHPIVLIEDLLGEVTGGVQTGKFVTLTTSEGLRWLVWRDGTFADLGTRLPEPKLRIECRQQPVRDYSPMGVGWPEFTLIIPIDPADTERMSTLLSGGNGRLKGSFAAKTQEAIDAAVNGLLEDFLLTAGDARLMIGPCRCVTALRMYDGSHTYWSEPMVIAPNEEAGGIGGGISGGLVISEASIDGDTLRCRVEIRSVPCSIEVTVEDPDRLALWSGIVESVDIFLTPEAPIWSVGKEVDGVTSIDHNKAWRLRNPTASAISLWLNEHSDYHLFATIDRDKLVASYSQGVPLSLADSLRESAETLPDFGWRIPFVAAGTGKVSGSAALWGCDTDWRLALSVNANPFVWPSRSRTTPDAGGILGVAPAVKSLSSGQLGEFPSYLFTTRGVWALRAGADGEIEAAQAISLHRLVAPRSFAVTQDGVAFLTRRGVILLNGSSEAVISDSVAKDLDYLAEKGEEVIIPDSDTLERSRIWYDYPSGNLIIWIDGDVNDTPCAWCYSFRYERWLAARAVGSGAKNATEPVVMETRALKLDGARKRRRVVDVEVIADGKWRQGEGIRLYGANIPGVWHLIADMPGRRIGRLAGTPWRFHKVVMRGFISAPYALIISVLQ